MTTKLTVNLTVRSCATRDLANDDNFLANVLLIFGTITSTLAVLVARVDLN